MCVLSCPSVFVYLVLVWLLGKYIVDLFDHLQNNYMWDDFVYVILKQNHLVWDDFQWLCTTIKFCVEAL